MAAFASNPYMVTIGLDNFGGSVYPYWNLLIPDLKLAGITWLRMQYKWSSMVPSQSTPPSGWNWVPFDDAVANCNAAGINLCLTINAAPTWALTTLSQQMLTGSGTDFQMDPYATAAFGEQIALRYNGANGHGTLQKLGYNESFNVDNAAPGTGLFGINNSPWTGLYNGIGGVLTSNHVQPARDPDFAWPVMAVAYPRIKAANPRLVVGMPCIWWAQPANPGGLPNTPVSNHYAFLSQLFAKGMKGYFDETEFHLYTNAVDPLTGSNQTASIYAVMSDLKSVLAANGLPNMPIVMSEFGWQVPAQCSAAVQATRISEMLSAFRAAGGTRAGIYTLDYRTATTDPSSIVAYNSGTYVYSPGWEALLTDIANNSQWTPAQPSQLGSQRVTGRTHRKYFPLS
jgi:hypothetical protein